MQTKNAEKSKLKKKASLLPDQISLNDLNNFSK